MAELIAARNAAMRGDIVELRLDGVSDVEVAQALHQRARPVIVTVRAAWEGGAFDGGEETRRALLRQALEAGAEYVDVEWRAGFADLIARDPRRIVVSSHDFQSVPSDLAARAVAMRQTGAGTIKIAIPATACHSVEVSIARLHKVSVRMTAICKIEIVHLCIN